MNYLKTIAVSAFFILFAAGAVFVSGFLGMPVAHADAAVPAVAADECSVTQADIAQIAAVQNDPTLAYADEIKQELAVRKQLVGETIDCAQQEVQALQTSLASTSAPRSAQQLQSQLEGDLNEATGFYNNELAKLDVVGIAGTKQIAQEVLTWRAGTFLPLGENVNNFILWAQNQDLFSTAQTRMTQTQRAVSFIEGATSNPALQSALTSSQSSFDDAQSENAAVEAALTQNLSPDQTLGLIKQSLSSLSDTYKGFSNVSAIISGVLPQ
ncbi:MAG: hypothetical protein ABR884_04215 [Minisyncoccia bacterium]|jgi:hypothetical protein